MEKYKPTFGIEPTDRYEKAKWNLLQAKRSIEALTPEEKERLANELFGVANVAAVMEMWRRFSGMR